MTDNEAKVFLSRIERFLKSAGMSATQFGYMSIGDPALVRDLKRGRVLRTSTIEKIQRFMERGK